MINLEIVLGGFALGILVRLPVDYDRRHVRTTGSGTEIDVERLIGTVTLRSTDLKINYGV